MTRTYGFNEQLAVGESGEALLDSYFSRWYTIEPVSMADQKRGIDRFFTPIEEPYEALAIEYKTDSRTQKTGNIFVETASSVESGKLGWAWTSTADYVVYLALPYTLYTFRPEDIQAKIPYWTKRYGLKNVKNRGYTTQGIAVPAGEFKRYCLTARSIRKEHDGRF